MLIEISIYLRRVDLRQRTVPICKMKAVLSGMCVKTKIWQVHMLQRALANPQGGLALVDMADLQGHGSPPPK